MAETEKLEETEQFKYIIALPPPSLYAQFPPETSAAAIWEGLHRLGFDEIFDVAVASEYISLEIAAYLKNYNVGRKPLISCTCPAVLRLIQVKFPELINGLPDISIFRRARCNKPDTYFFRSNFRNSSNR